MLQKEAIKLALVPETQISVRPESSGYLLASIINFVCLLTLMVTDPPLQFHFRLPCYGLTKGDSDIIELQGVGQKELPQRSGAPALPFYLNRIKTELSRYYIDTLQTKTIDGLAAAPDRSQK